MGHWTSVGGGSPVYVQGPAAEEKPAFTAQELQQMRRTGTVVRADSAKPELIKIVKTDAYSGAKMYEFRCPPGVSKMQTWMGQFTSVPLEGEINKDEISSPADVRNINRKHAERVANRSRKS